MKPQSQLLEKLQRLSAGDRAWIVERLSEQERTQLLATLAGPTNPPEETFRPVEPRRTDDTSDPVKTLARVEPRLVAAICRHEPAWLNAVLAAAQQESWRRVFLEALPATLRSEVERTQSSQFGAALTESVTRLILDRCHGDVPSESPFEKLVERLSSARSKRRMTLHL